MVYRRFSTRGKVVCLTAITAIVLSLALSIVGIQNRNMIRGFLGNGQQGDDGQYLDTVVTQLNVVDASTRKVILTLANDAILDVNTLGDVDNLDIEAVVVQRPFAGFIRFSFNGVDMSRSLKFPFSLCKELLRGQCSDIFVEGTHTVSAAPFASNGEPLGQEYTVTFVVISNKDENEGENDASDTVGPAENRTIPGAILVVGSGDIDEPSDSAPATDPVTEQEITTSIPLVKRPCGTPTFIDDWEWGVKKYPLTVAEAQGAKIGNDLLIVGGFIGGYSETTRQAFALNLTDEDAEWRRMDDMPTAIGITHGAYAVVGEKFYMCGGYVGGNIGIETDVCMEYDHSAVSGSQWRLIEPLPLGRAGGGMVYDSSLNVLLFSAGATRPKPGVSIAYDHNDSWMYNLSDPSSGWMNRTDIPFYGNHMGFVTARDEYNRERHFFVGGQRGEEEHTGNTQENYEWIASNDTWVARQSMPLSRGHAASATKAIGCGFMVIGGTTNEHGMTDDISFYDIPSNTWTTIGSLSSAVNTAVCEYGGGYLYCETGWANGYFSARRRMELSSSEDV